MEKSLPYWYKVRFHIYMAQRVMFLGSGAKGSQIAGAWSLGNLSAIATNLLKYYINAKKRSLTVTVVLDLVLSVPTVVLTVTHPLLINTSIVGAHVHDVRVLTCVIHCK